MTDTEHDPRHCRTCRCPPELLHVDTSAPFYALVLAIDALAYARPRRTL